MKVSTKAPGWLKVFPIDGNEELSCEIKIFTIEEGFEFDGDVRVGRLIRSEPDPKKPGKEKTIWDYYCPLAREYFKRFVKNFEGLEINGVKIQQPAELFDPSMGHSKDVTLFFIRALQELFEHNSTSEEEAKNSEAPSGGNGEESEGQTEPPVGAV